MSENYFRTDFEEFLRDRANQYKMYPSDRVWKQVNRSLRSRRRWYWSGFALMLAGISYFAFPDWVSRSTAPLLNNPPAGHSIIPSLRDAPDKGPAAPVPAGTHSGQGQDRAPAAGSGMGQLLNPRAGTRIDKSAGSVTAVRRPEGASLTGTLGPVMQSAAEAFEETAAHIPEHKGEEESSTPGTLSPVLFLPAAIAPAAGRMQDSQQPLAMALPGSLITQSLSSGQRETELAKPDMEAESRVNWLAEQAALRLPKAVVVHRIQWQLAFSPTINYRRLTGTRMQKAGPAMQSIPLAIQVEGDVNALVNHRPALGFELGTHGMLPVSRVLTLKAGIQFNYSKYDIRAFRTSGTLTTIALNSGVGTTPGNALVSYTDISNFGGSKVEELKNQYYQLSLPVGAELLLLGNGRIGLHVAGTLQPTYLLNGNTYLITTDFKNYTRAPSLVRRWNLNTGAEAFLSYSRGDIKWQMGPQFRYQLLSSYENVYPIREQLMEYGIKIGVTKTLR